MANRSRSKTAPSIIRFVSACMIGCVLSLGCGRVSDPLPPLVKTPAPVSDLTVVQVGYELRVEWTNPLRNIDQSASTDLALAFVEAEGVVVAETEVSGPGQRQVLRLPAEELVGSRRQFTVHFQTDSGRTSSTSNPIEVTVVDVPGPVSDLEASVDQDRILLEWTPPVLRGDLVDGYRIYRSGVASSDTPVPITRYAEMEYEVEAVYEYTVVPVRRVGGSWVEGIESGPLSVRAVDTTPPGAPTGLSLTVVDNRAFVVWRTNPEPDVVRYQVFRRERAADSFLPVSDEPQATTGYTDPDYAPGHAYRVLAVDRSGNTSALSDLVDAQ